MKPAEFWAETPHELLIWLQAVATSTKDQTWIAGKLVAVAFHDPKSFPDIDTFTTGKKKPMSYAAMRLGTLIASKEIDKSILPSWAH